MNKIIDNGNFVLRARISRIATIDPDLKYYWFGLSTQILTAKRPDVDQSKFAALFTDAQLGKLRNIIDLQLLHKK